VLSVFYVQNRDIMKLKKPIFIITLLIVFVHSAYCQFEPEIRYKNRIGVTIGSGEGFTTIPILTLINGTVASISFGGGTIVTLEYARKFNRHFETAMNIGGQFSQLDKSIVNGSMTFNRIILSLTPALVLPIGKKQRMCLKFGGGLDYLFGANLEFDFSQITGGIKDKWKYNEALGEHICINYELNTKKRFSFNFGLKAYNASYSFKSGNLSYPVDDRMKNPSGAGIDFNFGFNFNFNWIKPPRLQLPAPSTE
jgi:hypothetical protein